MSASHIAVMAAQSISGGGGGSVAFSAGGGAGFTFDSVDGTTPSFTPGGSNRAIFGVVAGLQPFGAPPSIDDCKYGGSGGTSLTEITGSDQTFGSGAGAVSTYAAASGPTGSTTGYGNWSGDCLGASVCMVAYENVNQTTPYDEYVATTGTEGTASSFTASITLTGTTAGQTYIGRVSCSFGNNDGLDFEPIAGTTIRAQPTTGESRTWLGTCWLEKVATGTSTTLEVTMRQTTSTAFTWAIDGMRVVPA